MRVRRVRLSDAAIRRLVLAFGAAGILFTIVLARRLGGPVLLGHMAALGPAAPLILILTGLRYPLQAAGWRLALTPAARPPWPQAIGATLAGSAVSYLTFAGPVAGEPARAMLLRGHTSMASGIAAGAVERAIYAISGTFVTAAGFAVAAASLGHGRRMSGVAWGVAAVLAVAAVLGLRLIARRRGPAASNRPPSAWRETVGELWRTRRPALAGILLADIAQHALLLAEAWVILHALGVPARGATVLVFESMMKAANSLGTFVPGGAGVTEAGSALLAAGLGVGASVGLTLALVRRARAIAWAMAGLAIMGASGLPAWRRRSRPGIGPTFGAA